MAPEISRSKGVIRLEQLRALRMSHLIMDVFSMDDGCAFTTSQPIFTALQKMKWQKNVLQPQGRNVAQPSTSVTGNLHQIIINPRTGIRDTFQENRQWSEIFLHEGKVCIIFHPSGEASRPSRHRSSTILRVTFTTWNMRSFYRRA